LYNGIKLLLVAIDSKDILYSLFDVKWATLDLQTTSMGLAHHVLLDCPQQLCPEGVEGIAVEVYSTRSPNSEMYQMINMSFLALECVIIGPSESYLA
jgi:hypothetical protein